MRELAIKNKRQKIGSTTELADLLALTTRRVNQLVDEEIISREADGNFDLPRAIADYYEYKFGEAEEADYLAEKAKHEAAKRQLAELELAKRKNEVHEAADVELVMTDMLVNLRSQLLALPNKLAPLLADRDQGYIAQVITTEIEERLKELSDYSPLLFDGSGINAEQDD